MPISSLALTNLPQPSLPPTAAPRDDAWRHDQPAEQVVDDWPTAAALAGVTIAAPLDPDLAGPEILVRGVEGDPTRPVDATWSSGLRIIQAHRDVMEPPEPSETITLTGVDEAWEAEVRGVETLYARRGRTLAS